MRVLTRSAAISTMLLAAAASAARAQSGLDALRQLLENPRLSAADRQRLQNQIRQYEARRKQLIAKRQKELEKESLEAVKEAFEKGNKAYQEQRYSAAYLHFKTVAACKLPKAAKMAGEAKSKVIEIEGMAEAKVEQAEVMVRRGDPTGAAELFAEVVAGFPYSESAKRASRRLQGLRNTPSVAATLRYQEGKAQEDAEGYLAALKIYDEVAERWPEEVAALRARVAAKKIRRDPEKMELAREELEAEAERVCPGLINVAENYILNGDAAHAREKLNQVVKDYPGTTYAEQAQTMLDALAASGGPGASGKKEPSKARKAAK